jgi:transposase InsO family protein
MLTEEAERLFHDVDAVGRYGHALKLMYEQSLGVESTCEARERLSRAFQETAFYTMIQEDVGDAKAEPDRDARSRLYRGVRDDGARLLSKRGSQFADWEMLTPGPAGTRVLLDRSPAGPTGIMPQLVAGRDIFDITSASDGFAEDPQTYLSSLRQDAEASTLDMAKAAATLARREEKRLRRSRKVEARRAKTLPEYKRALKRLKRGLPQERAEALALAEVLDLGGRDLTPLMPMPVEGKSEPYEFLRPRDLKPVKSHFPRTSALAALESLPGDSYQLQTLIQQRLKGLGPPSGDDDG